MTYTISKDFGFSSSHQLDGLPEDHPCSRLHGHNYILNVTLTGNLLDHTGFLFDYRALEPIKRWVDEELDHRHLNDVFDFNPTSERICAHVHGLVRKLVDIPAYVNVRVGLSETPKTWAYYEEGR